MRYLIMLNEVGSFSCTHRNCFVYQAVNMFISPVKMGMLTMQSIGSNSL